MAPEYFEKWWGYGTLFIACAVLQVLYAPLLLRRPGRTVPLVGAGGNLVVVILWLVTRTTRIPLPGPHAGEIEDADLFDLARPLAEVGTVACLGALTMRGFPTEKRIRIVVVTAASSLPFCHLLHLLGASAAR